MKRSILLSVVFLLFGVRNRAQTLSSIFTDVDTIGLEQSAGPGELALNNASVTPLASTHCSTDIKHYAVASTYQDGRAIGMAHEGFLSDNNIGLYDNTTFISQATNWLSQGNTLGTVTIKNGWINNGNTTTLQNELQTLGYTVNTTNTSFSTSSLASTDVLIIGNDWNGTTPYSATEIAAVNNFVANGGGVLVVGLGWSWPNALSDYPMNNIATLFGFEFTTAGLNSNVYTNLHPIDTSFSNCPSSFLGTNISRGDTLRVIRLAVSVTGEFTQELSGVSNTETVLNNWLSDINTIYGREYCMRFELVPNNTNLIFPDPVTDPWATMPLGSGGCNNSDVIMSDQESVIDSIIGSNNYDVSHVILSTQHLGGGCAGSYTSGISGGFDIPVTRHEIGHQFGQSHTINHSGLNNYEPENGGWTMQGGNGQGRAHAVSFHELALNLLNHPLVGSKITTGNAIPTIDVGEDVTIPISTPFTLTVQSSDADSEDSLTYVWDNMDKGFPHTIPLADDSYGAIFMRLLPTPSTSRTFPNIEDVIANNNSNTQEQLPTQSRTMNIRVTVNDNATMIYNGQEIPSSGINSDDISITVDDSSGPFVITSQNTSGIVYNGGTIQELTWDVNGTDVLPVNAAHVKISLSEDGGYTFPIVITQSTVNDGSEFIEIPNVNTDKARIKVEAVGNIFFDLNMVDFEIVSTIGLNNLESPFKIYPNPTQNILHIKTDLANYKITVLSINGEHVMTGDNSTKIELKHLNSGIYFIELYDIESGQISRKKMVHL